MNRQSNERDNLPPPEKSTETCEQKEFTYEKEHPP